MFEINLQRLNHKYSVGLKLASKPISLKLVIKEESNDIDLSQKFISVATQFFESKVSLMFRSSINYLINFMKVLVLPYRAQIHIFELIDHEMRGTIDFEVLFSDFRIHALDRVDFKVRLWQDHHFYDLGVALKLRGKEYDLEIGLNADYIVNVLKSRELSQPKTLFSYIEALSARQLDDLKLQSRALS